MNKALDLIVDLLFKLPYFMLAAFVGLFVPARKKDVSDDIVLITGAGSGIGRLLAKKFAALGSTIVLWDINNTANDAVAADINSEHPGKAYAYKVDCSNREEVYKTADLVKRDVGDVAILINNAGIVTGKKFFDLPDEKIEQTFNINSIAHFWTIKAFFPPMKANNHGHIVTIASTAGLGGVSGLVDYCSSKFAAVGTHSALTTELYALKLDGVHTTCVCPYIVDTGMFAGTKTRYPLLMPVLKEDYVASKIVTAVLTNQNMLILPRIVYFLHFLQSFLPIKATMEAGKLLGFNELMDNFVGRQKAE